MTQDGEKRAAGKRAAELIEDGMRVGLGTGSTVRHLVEALGARGADIVCLATSAATEALAGEQGLRLASTDEVERLDLTIDGADEIDPRLNLTKGGGGAHVREKIVARMSERFVVIADAGKLVPQLGPFGTPLEVLEWGVGPVIRALTALGAHQVVLRSGLSDNGNPIADAQFGAIPDPAALAAEIDAVPGVVGHGLFPGTWVERVIVGEGSGVREILADEARRP